MGLALAQGLGEVARYLVWRVTAVAGWGKVCGSARGNSPSPKLTDTDIRSVAQEASAIATRGGAPG